MPSLQAGSRFGAPGFVIAHARVLATSLRGLGAKVGAKPLAKVFMPGTVEPRLRLFLGSDLGMPRRRGGRMCRPVRGSGSFAAHSPEADAVGLLDVSPRWGS